METTPVWVLSINTILRFSSVLFSIYNCPKLCLFLLHHSTVIFSLSVILLTIHFSSSSLSSNSFFCLPKPPSLFSNNSLHLIHFSSRMNMKMLIRTLFKFSFVCITLDRIEYFPENALILTIKAVLEIIIYGHNN